MSALREVLAVFGIQFDSTELKKGNEEVLAGIEGIKKYGAALGAGLGLYAAKEFLSGLIEQADALTDQSDALGLSAQEIQEWSYAADLGGSSADAFLGAIKRMQSGASDKGLAALGIATTDATGAARTATDIFEDTADALSKIDNPAERAGKAAGVFGKSFAGVMPLLNQGAEGIAKLRAEFRELGGGFDSEFIENAAEAKDEADRLHVVLQSLKITVAASVLPTIRSLLGDFVKLAKGARDLAQNTKVIEVAMVALALKGAVFLSGKIGGLGSALKLLGKTAATTLIPLLILEDFLVFMAGGDSLFGRWVDKAFGPGTSEQIRKWVEDVQKEVTGFFHDLIKAPEKFRDDMALLFEGMKNKKFWQYIFGDGALAEWGQFFSLLLLEPGEFGPKFKAALMKSFGIGAEEAKPRVETEQERKSFLDKIPGLTAIRDYYGPGRAIADQMGADQAAAESAAQIREPGGAPRIAFGSPSVAGANTTVTIDNRSQTTVQVAPGTPRQQASDVADAASSGAQSGAQKSAKALRAALVPSTG